MESTDSSQVCCPKFDPSPWEEKTIAWQDKLFMQDNVRQFLHIPLNMSQVVTRMWKKINDAKAEVETKDFIMLSFDPSPWTSQLFMTVTKDVPGAKMSRLSGTFLTKVFDGPYNAVPKWIKEMDQYVASQGKQVQKYYFYYTTCPKCAKKYGHNYVVVFAQVSA